MRVIELTMTTKSKSVQFVMALSLLFLFPVFGSGEKIPEKTVELTYLFNFEQLKPKLNCNFIALPNPIAIDDKKNLYYCEMSNNRILKLSLKGEFIKEIGPTGQKKSSLYFPSGIHIKDNILFVLDEAGKYVKMFDLDGKFLKSFVTHDKERVRGNSIAVGDSNFYCDLRFTGKQWNDHKLITEFSKEGIRKATYGRIVRSKLYRSYETINRAYLVFQNNKVYGAFFAYPAVFCYDRNGKEQLFRPLNIDSKDNELDSIFGIEMDYNSNNDGTPGKVRFQCYIWGLAVDEKGNYLLALNSFSLRRGFILKLNPAGDPMEKIRFIGNGKELFPVYKIINTPDGKTYIAGKIQDSGLCLFEWKNKNL